MNWDNLWRSSWARLRYGVPKYCYRNETQNDRWIMECIFPNKTDGYFVELGACNGITGSSCYLLETQRQWRGLCVEPHSAFFEELIQNRPGSQCLNLCVQQSSGIVDFEEGIIDPVTPFLSGIPQHLAANKNSDGRLDEHYRYTKKTAISLVDLLRTQQAPAIIDYLAIDIEGSELPALAEFPFDQYRFRALSLECDGRIWNDITELLHSNGYREVRNPFNLTRLWERYWLTQ